LVAPTGVGKGVNFETCDACGVLVAQTCRIALLPSA
jgi:hypothetical protein